MTFTGYSDPRKHVRALSGLAQKGRILDLGAGGGQYRSVLCTLGEYVSVDIVGNPDIQSSVYNLPFAAGTFDSVALFMVLEHLAEPKQALRECSRTLKPGGTLMLTTPQYWHFHSWPNDYFRYTKEGLRHLCNESNLDIVEMKSMGGPFLVLFHVIDVNLRLYGGSFRRLFVYNPLALIFNLLDFVFFRHQDTRAESDSVGWALVARKER
jgi:SAM-dependent methyltransferase